MERAGGQQRTNVRRANVTACQRCKSRKQRCDQNIPACSACARARVTCISVDTDGRAAPRSYIKNLEDRVAQLETMLTSRGLATTPTGHEGQTEASSQPSLSPGVVSDSDMRSSAVIPATDPSQSGNLPLLHLLMPDPRLWGNGTAGGYHALLKEIPPAGPPRLPPQTTAARLLEAYFEHSDFFSPILERESFQTTLTAAYAAEHHSTQNPQERFRVAIVLAIAIRLLNRTDATVPTAGSEALFASAIIIFNEQTRTFWSSALDHLQNLLLIVQYVIFSSNIPAAWYFIGMATRLVIDLGLHAETRLGNQWEEAETENTASAATGMTDKKRRLFWSTYVLETNLCTVLKRPRSIPDEAIDTPLPLTEGSNPFLPLANHCVIFRQLESEIQSTLNYKPPVNGAKLDYRVWREGMKSRLFQWHSSSPPLIPSSKLAPPSFFEGGLYNSLVQIYAPSHWLPDPPPQELLELSQYACKSIKLYRRDFKGGRLRFYWRTIYNLFHSGAALVDCIKTLAPLNDLSVDLNDMKRHVTTCSTVLWGMVERYPPGQVFRDRFEELASSIFDISSSSVGIPSSAAHELLLSQDVIPSLAVNDTAFSWGTTPPDLSMWEFNE